MYADGSTSVIALPLASSGAHDSSGSDAGSSGRAAVDSAAGGKSKVYIPIVVVLLGAALAIVVIVFFRKRRAAKRANRASTYPPYYITSSRSRTAMPIAGRREQAQSGESWLAGRPQTAYADEPVEQADLNVMQEVPPSSFSGVGTYGAITRISPSRSGGAAAGVSVYQHPYSARHSAADLYPSDASAESHSSSPSAPLDSRTSHASHSQVSHYADAVPAQQQQAQLHYDGSAEQGYASRAARGVDVAAAQRAGAMPSYEVLQREPADPFRDPSTRQPASAATSFTDARETLSHDDPFAAQPRVQRRH